MRDDTSSEIFVPIIITKKLLLRNYIYGEIVLYLLDKPFCWNFVCSEFGLNQMKGEFYHHRLLKMVHILQRFLIMSDSLLFSRLDNLS